jgi:hypothetical protein
VSTQNTCNLVHDGQPDTELDRVTYTMLLAQAFKRIVRMLNTILRMKLILPRASLYNRLAVTVENGSKTNYRIKMPNSFNEVNSTGPYVKELTY